MILVAASHAREKKLDFGDGNVALITQILSPNI